jgi:hypothetical protein
VTISFLDTPEPTAAAQELFDEDLADLGYVMNSSRLWAYRPAAMTELFDLLTGTARAGERPLREFRAVGAEPVGDAISTSKRPRSSTLRTARAV